MIAETLRTFCDLAEKVMRNPGDRFEVTEERFAELNATRYGVLVKAVEEQPEDEPDAQSEEEPEKPRRGRKQD